MNNINNNSHVHIKINIFRILSYLIVYGIFGVLLFIYLRGYISLIILTIFIVLPLFEIFISLKLSKVLRVSVSISDESLTIHERLGVGIIIENDSFCSGLNLFCDINLNNVYFDTMQTQKIVLPIHPHKNPSHPIVFETNSIGLIQVELKRYTLRDVFGFVDIYHECSGEVFYIKVLPIMKEVDDSIRESLVLGVNDNEDNTKKGNELAETGNIREYIPGDRIKDIHWKLSAKRDLLLVKERISTSESRMVLWISSSKGRRVCEMILSLSLEIMYSCVDEGRLMEVFWYDYHTMSVEGYTVEGKNDIYSAFEKIYSGGHGEQPDGVISLMSGAGYNYNNVLGVRYDGNEIRVNLYEA